MYAVGPNRGREARISRSLASASAGASSARSVRRATAMTSDAWSSRSWRTLSMVLTVAGSPLAERDDDQRREQADARVWIAVGGGDRAQAILDQAHGVVAHRERGAEAEQQRPDVVCVRLQDTIRISWLVLFRRRPPSSVTVTMSSIRTPKRSGR